MAHVKDNNENDLDDLLESALDDFDDDDDDPKEDNTSISSTNDGNGKTSKYDSQQDYHHSQQYQDEKDDMSENMNKLMEDIQNPDFQKTLEMAIRQLSTEEGEGLKSLLDPFENAETAVQGTEVDRGVAKTLQNMADMSSKIGDDGTTNVEDMGEDVMNDMMKQFEQMGEKEDFQGMIDNMMQQLMSRDVMYEPMKQICEKYPEWLEEKESQLSKEDYERYGRQYKYFQQIVAVYENEPDNYPRLMELMQDMQECGQPPSEIVKELAPGLEFDQEGMPIMPNLGQNPLAGLAQGMNLPGQEQCSMM